MNDRYMLIGNSIVEASLFQRGSANAAIIWITFIVDFGIEFLLAPRRISYLRHNWLTAFSLFIPALSIFRIVRVMQSLQSVHAVRGLQMTCYSTSIGQSLMNSSRGKTTRHSVS